MALSQDEKRAMLAATHDLAWNMLDDLKHMREIIAKPTPSSGDIRRISNLVRRLLIDGNGDLPKISAPRLGRRLELLAPDVHPAIKDREQSPVYLDSVGVSGVFGTTAARIIIGLPGKAFLPKLPEVPKSTEQPPSKEPYWEISAWKGEGDEVPRTVSLRLDNFRAQQVMYFEGKWIRRHEVITYVANIAGGVHSGKPKEPSDFLLERVRKIGWFSSQTGHGVISIGLSGGALPGTAPGAEVSKEGVDFVLQQLLAAARYVTISPDVVELEEIIKAEQPG